MAILHRKEEKIQVVLGRLPKQYGHEQFIEMFIKLYSKDWGKIKSAYIKQSQDKEPGTVVNMPKPELYLKQLLETYLANRPAETEVAPIEKAKAEPVAAEDAPVKKAKAAPKKKAEPVAVKEAPIKKVKATAKNKAEEVVAVKEEKPKTTSKKKTTEEKAKKA